MISLFILLECYRVASRYTLRGVADACATAMRSAVCLSMFFGVGIAYVVLRRRITGMSYT